MALKDDILSYLSILKDISPETYKIYEEKFSVMNDAQIKHFFANNDVRLYVQDNQVTQAKVDDLAKKCKIVTEEKIHYPHKGDTDTMHEFLVLPIQIRRLQQIASTESHSSLDSSVRDKVNQATRESRTSVLNKGEIQILASIGLDNTLSELMSPRSDNQLGKQKMNELIRENGTFRLADIPKTPQSRNSVTYLDSLYKAMGLATDLVDDINDIS